MRLADLIYGKVDPVKVEPSKETLRKVQLIMLEILIEVHKICKKYRLRYWLDSGSLLGAIRHEGFIPWDDDLDICMPYEDYKIFLNVAQKELPDGMFLQTRATDKKPKNFFAKVRSNKGRILERFEVIKLMQGRKISYNTGIYIDIFPCITIKQNEAEKYEFLLTISNKIRKWVGIGFIVERTYNFIDKFIHKGWGSEDLLVVRSTTFYEPKFKVPVSSIFPLRLYTFEGYQFWGPNDYDTYLRVLYGDYMKLPPPEERHTHAYLLEVFE